MSILLAETLWYMSSVAAVMLHEVFVSLVCVQEVAGLMEDLPTVSQPTSGDSSSCRNTQQSEVLFSSLSHLSSYL